MFKRIIKIPGKRSFTDLSLKEVALMILADSSLSKEGNSSFASCALDEFLHFSNLDGRPDLQNIQTTILKNIYIDVAGTKTKEINTEFLKKYANEIQANANNAL